MPIPAPPSPFSLMVSLGGNEISQGNEDISTTSTTSASGNDGVISVPCIKTATITDSDFLLDHQER
ncbi:MAG: hypothetical protein V7K48_01990 [Nostoc sp.]|uniref:hypothetical protein n=1 Tax=Nostoc sp. TaxID=1180 RepID=UPI002FF8D4C3